MKNQEIDLLPMHEEGEVLCICASESHGLLHRSCDGVTAQSTCGPGNAYLYRHVHSLIDLFSVGLFVSCCIYNLVCVK